MIIGYTVCGHCLVKCDFIPFTLCTVILGSGLAVFWSHDRRCDESDGISYLYVCVYLHIILFL